MQGTTTKPALDDAHELPRGDNAEDNVRRSFVQRDHPGQVLDRPRASTSSQTGLDDVLDVKAEPEIQDKSEKDETSRDLTPNAENARPSTGTPQDHTSPSDDVSLNIGATQQEQEETFDANARGERIRSHDTVEERRVAFLPPPRVSPVFIPPHSSYPVGPPPIGSAYGTPPMGQIGVHYPREIIRIERDYSGGEVVQFYPIYPLELEGRITPTQWLDTVNGINEILISAHSLKRAAVHHILSVITLYISAMLMESHYEKEMSRLRTFIDQCNEQLYHSQGLNILWPRSNGFLFLEIEYY